MNQSVVSLWRKPALAAIALLIALLMLPNLVWLVYSHALTTWIEALILPAALLTVVFAFLGRWPWLTCLLLAPFALLAPLETFYIATYQTPSSAQIIATLVTTNGPEVLQYLGWALPFAIITPLIGLALALTAAWLSSRTQLSWCGRIHDWIIAIAIATPLLSSAVGFATASGSLGSRAQSASYPIRILGASLRHGFPLGIFQRVATFHYEWSTMRADAQRFKDFSFHARRAGTQPHRRQVYVLVIGESDARSHWQLFGYPRATNPELTTMTNLVPITRMVTPWSVTLASVPVILTRKPITSPSPAWKEPSFLPAMREAGYETWWISNQYPIGQFDSPIATYAYEAQHVVWVNHTVYWDNPGAYDGAIIPALKRALHHSNHDMFIVLHLMGSHFQYDYRYPPQFAHFKPVQFDSQSRVPGDERIRNSYDNSIRYTDHVLEQVIGTLKQSDATTALWFESDHGDVLPTSACHQQGHGIGTWHEFEIPAFFWYSNSYAHDFPARIATLRTNAIKRTMTGDTFATMLGMAGVDFPGLDHARNLFSPTWRYRTRWVSQLWKSNFDDSTFGKQCGIVMPADPQADSH